LKARKIRLGEDESSFDRAAVAAMTPEQQMALSWRITKDFLLLGGSMEPQSDWIALLREFYAAGVEYMVVGAEVDTNEQLAISTPGFGQLRRTLDSSFTLSRNLVRQCIRLQRPTSSTTTPCGNSEFSRSGLACSPELKA
jgi:hypothetical protein